MAGPNLEVFKFGFYMFFPIYIMFKFGDPQWYNDYVQPYKEIIWPPYESTHKPPRSTAELHEELARLKAERLARQSGQAGQAGQAGQHVSAESGGKVAEELAKVRAGSRSAEPATAGGQRSEGGVGVVGGETQGQNGRWDWATGATRRLV